MSVRSGARPEGACPQPGWVRRWVDAWRGGADAACPRWLAAGCPTLLECLDEHQADGGSEPSLAEAPVWKRALDLACILVLLPGLLPLMALIAAVIKVVSHGPVFFRQERVGLGGKLFRCYKFRTMRHNADTGVHQDHLRTLMHSDRPMTKIDAAGDPRLIPFGAWLRASGLDELPQLINVVRGQMSLVGPRPCTPYEFENYLPWQKERFNTLPGLTGLWQVTGKNKTTFRQMIALDIFYARHKSPFVDAVIMAKTFRTLLEQVREAKARRRPAVEVPPPHALPALHHPADHS